MEDLTVCGQLPGLVFPTTGGRFRPTRFALHTLAQTGRGRGRNSQVPVCARVVVPKVL